MKLKLAFMVVTTLALAAFFGAHAQPASAKGAVVIRNTGCGMLDGNGGFVFTTNTLVVGTPSGNDKLQCRAKVPNSSGKAVHYDFQSTGLICGTFFNITTTWHETVSASGRATLTCVVNGSST
jgi:hypothetical protein